MKKYFLLINVIVGFSCSSTVEQQTVIPSSQMVTLLIDIHILEARVDKLRISKDSSYTVYNSLEKEIFEKNGISKKDYEDSYQYYLSNPSLLDQLYGIVVDSLNVIQKRGYQHKSEMVELDSAFLSNKIIDSTTIKASIVNKNNVLKDDLKDIQEKPTITPTEKPKSRIIPDEKPNRNLKVLQRDPSAVKLKRASTAKINQDSLK